MLKDIKSTGCLILAQAAIGVNIVIIKYLIQFAPLLLLIAMRFAISALFLVIIFCFLPKNHPQQIKLDKNDYFAIFAQALCAGFLFNLLIVFGLSFTQASEAGIITSLLPIMIVIFSFLLLKERLAKHQVIAIGISVLALIFVNMNKEGSASALSENLLGNFLIFLALIPESMFTIIAKWHGSKLPPLRMARWVVSINALLLLPFIVYYFKDLTHLLSVPVHFLILGIFGLLDASFYILWYQGLKHVSASKAALYTPVMPITVMLLAALFLGESISTFEILAILFITFAIILANQRKGYVK